MRVLLLQSFLGRLGVADQLVFPIGLSCVATALAKAGHEPWIVDLNVGGDPWVRLAAEIVRFKPDVIGVSQRNIDSTTRKAPFVYHTQLRPTLEIIRQYAPEARTVIGGPGFTQTSAELFRRYAFEFGLKSEAESSMIALLESLDSPERVPGLYWRRDGEVRYNGDAEMPHFEALPMPNRSFVDWEVYRKEEKARGLVLDIGIETTRGCPRKCAYCNYPALNGVKLRRKPPALVVDEIEYLMRDFGVEHFTFTDSRFNENIRHATEICEEILTRGVKIHWTAWLGFRRCSAEFLALMRRAGCVRVAFSPDGLLQPSLDRMQKEISTAEILDTVRAVRAVPGLKASWSFFATPPDTSIKEQFAYLGAYAWIHATLPGRGRMMVGWCRVEERTRFQTIAEEDGVVGPEAELLPEHAEGLEQLFYVAPGFEAWSGFWNGFLDAELVLRAAAGKATAPLRRFGFRNLTPRHMRGMDMAATLD